jgi:hypothetical protein
LNGVTKMGEHPFAGGGFADVFIGKYAGNKVALKVLRVYKAERNRKALVKVCVDRAYLKQFR